MAATWQLDADRAVVKHGPLSGQITLLAPAHGIKELSLEGVPLPGALLGANIENAIDGRQPLASDRRWELEDAYVRGEDLVVTYRPQAALPFRWQVDWQCVDPTGGALSVINMIVSVQTPLLETCPVVTVGSQLIADQVQLLSADGRELVKQDPKQGNALIGGEECRIAMLTTSSGWRLAEMVHASDFGGCWVSGDAQGRYQTEWRMGESFMEKGVIRRMRIRAAVLPQDATPATACQQFHELANEAPPLTA